MPLPRPKGDEATKAGRILITIAALSFPLLQWLFDVVADTHVRNPAWPPHARFHAMVLVLVGTEIALLALWLIWRSGRDPDTQIKIAALIPIMAWGAFFPAILVPGTAIYDPSEHIDPTVRLPVPLINAAIFSLLSVLGYALYVRGRRRVDRTTREAE